MIQRILYTNNFEDERIIETVPWRAGLTFRELVPEAWPTDSVAMHIDGEPAAPGWEDRQVDDGMTVSVVRVPGFEAALAKIVLGALLSAAVSYATSRLLGPAEPKAQRGDEESPTYSFSGVAQSRADGAPIAIIFGRLRLGGQVIAEYASTPEYPPETTLYMLISFGHGRIRSIGGKVDNPSDAAYFGTTLPDEIEIDGNTTDNFPLLKAYVRRGTQEQTVVPGFEDLRVERAVGLTLLQETTSNADNSPISPLLSHVNDLLDATSNPVWNTYGRTFNITANPVDAFTIRFFLPGGLYTVDDSTGDLEESQFLFAIRYREIDDLGAPVTSGGPDGDGYVRFQVYPELKVNKRGEFRYEVTQDVYDPQLWPGQPLTACADLTSGASSNLTIPQLPNYPHADGEDIDALSIAFWVWVEGDDLPPIPTQQTRVIAGTRSASKGWQIVARRKFFDLGGAEFNYYAWRLGVHWGNGSTFFVDQLFSTENLTAEQWTHVVFTYDLDPDGSGLARVRIYVDGEMRAERRGVSANIEESGEDIVFNDPTFPDNIRHLVDDLHIFRKELTATEIAELYNDGSGNGEEIGSDTVAYYSFNTDESNEAATPFPWFGTGVLASGATAGVTIGHVFGPTANAARRRMRLGVEVMRVNVDSENDRTVDDVEWEAIVEITRSAVNHGGLALLGLVIPAIEQLNSNRPEVTAIVEGLEVPVYDGETVQERYSANPAWCCLGLLTSKVYGMGDKYTTGNVDLEDLLDWANYNDEIVYDGSRSELAGISNPWNNITYEASTVDPYTGEQRGSFIILYSSGNTPPSAYTAGRFIKLYNVPTPSGFVAMGVDSPGTVGGYEIKSRTAVGASIWIECYWDRLSEGHPMTDGSDLQTELGIIDLAPAYSTGGERRHSFNGIFDDEGNAWDRLITVARAGLAFPIRRGSKVSFVWQRPRILTRLASMGHIVPGTFKCNIGGPRYNPNVVEVEYYDRDLGYELTTERGVHSTVAANATNQRISPAEFVRGITTRSAARRFGIFRANVLQELRRSGELVMSRTGIPLLPGDLVRIGHSIMPRRGYSGRLAADAPSTTVVTIDVEFEILAGKTYRIYIESEESGTRESRPINTPTTPGVYPAGSPITISSGNPLTNPPKKRDAWIIASDQDGLLVDVVSTQVNPNMTVLVRWVEYRESVYNVVLDPFQLDEDIPSPLLGPGMGGAGTIPAPPSIENVEDQIVRGASGAYERVIFVSWTNDPTTAASLRETRVGYRAVGSQAISYITTVQGRGSTASFPLPRGFGVGSRIQVALQQVGFGGSAQGAPTLYTITLRNRGPVPQPISGIRYAFLGRTAKFVWALPDGYDDAVVECRIGGWILGQTLFVSSPGAKSISTDNWIGSTVGAPPLHFRLRAPTGIVSQAVIGTVFNPVPATDWFPFQGANADQAWEDYGTGWVDSAGADDATLTDLAVNVDGDLEFDGAVLTGNYVTASPALGGMRRRRPQRCFVEAYAEGKQIHPIQFSAGAVDRYADPGVLSGNWEGPVQPGGTSPCTLLIEWRMNIDGTTTGWEAWADYKPGVYTLVEAQFRVTVTRPDTDHDVAISAFRTRIIPVTRSEADHDGRSHYLLQESF